MAEALIAPPPGFELVGAAMPPPPPGFELQTIVRRDMEKVRQIFDTSAPKTAKSFQDYWDAGMQQSVGVPGISGLSGRGKAPDVVVGPDAAWYERWVAGAAGLAGDAPAMFLGASAALALTAGRGGPVAMGAGAFAAPMAIRAGLMDAYTKGEVTTTGEFINRTLNIAWEGFKGGVTGAATVATGGVVGGVIGKTVSAVGPVRPMIASSVGRSAVTTASELATMVTVGKAMEGHLPEWNDFVDGALLIWGLKGTVAGVGKLAKIYEKTGKTPAEVVADARRDPTIAEDLMDVAQAAIVSRNEWAQKLSRMSPEELERAHAESVAHNYKFEVEAVEKFLGSEARAEFEARPTRRAKDTWLDKNITDEAQTWLNGRQVPEETIREYHRAATDFDTESPQALGRSIAIISKDVDKPDFMDSAEGLTFRNALNYAKEQGWDMDAVLGGMRARSEQWAGRDASELFERLFTAPSKRQPAAPIALPSPEIPRAYAPLADAETARAIVPGQKAAEVAANPFVADLPQKPGEPSLSTHVNYNLILGPEQVRLAQARLSEVYLEDIQTQRRGTQTWEETIADGQRMLADTLGGVDRRLLEPREPGTPAGAAEIWARNQMMQGAAREMSELANKYDALTATAEQTLQFHAAIERAAMISSEYLGARAEPGRALNIIKATKDTALYAEQVQEVLRLYGGKDPAILAKMIKEIDSTAGALKFARDVSKATKWEMVIEAYKAGLIGPVSQVANVLGNTTFLVTHDMVDVIASLRPGGQVKMVEPLARVIGQFQGAYEGLKIAGEFLGENWKQPMVALRTLDAKPSVKMEQHRKAIPGDLGVLVRGLSFPWLSVGDGAFRLMIERGEANSLAARQAINEGLNPFTREFRERMADLAQNPSADMAAKIQAYGTRGTFQDRLGPWGQDLQKLIAGSKVGPLFIPYTQTPGNVFKEMARLGPLTQPFVKAWREDFKAGGAARDKALAEIAVGGATMGVMVALALDERVTGYGPPEPDKRRVWMLTHQPYSLKIGETFYDYSRIQPIGTLIGFAADMAEIWEHMTPEETDKLPRMISIAFSQAVTNQIWLRGLVDIARGVAESDRYGPKIVQNLAASMMPASGWLGQTANLMDPYIREINGIMDAIRNKIPGVREGLIAQRDAFGEPLQNPERLGVVSPVKTRTPSDDLVLTEAVRLGVGIAKAPKTIDLPAGHDRKLGEVKLTPEQRDMFADVTGPMAHDILERHVNSPSWESRKDPDKKRIYELVIEQSRKAARSKVLSPEQRREEMDRINTEIRRRHQ